MSELLQHRLSSIDNNYTIITITIIRKCYVLYSITAQYNIQLTALEHIEPHRRESEDRRKQEM